MNKSQECDSLWKIKQSGCGSFFSVCDYDIYFGNNLLSSYNFNILLSIIYHYVYEMYRGILLTNEKGINNCEISPVKNP